MSYNSLLTMVWVEFTFEGVGLVFTSCDSWAPLLLQSELLPTPLLCLELKTGAMHVKLSEFHWHGLSPFIT